jgi:hypothetical protein
MFVHADSCNSLLHGGFEASLLLHLEKSMISVPSVVRRGADMNFEICINVTCLIQSLVEALIS